MKHLGKVTEFVALKLKISVLRKMGSSFLLRQIVNKSECKAVTQFALQPVCILII